MFGAEVVRAMNHDSDLKLGIRVGVDTNFLISFRLEDEECCAMQFSLDGLFDCGHQRPGIDTGTRRRDGVMGFAGLTNSPLSEEF